MTPEPGTVDPNSFQGTQEELENLLFEAVEPQAPTTSPAARAAATGTITEFGEEAYCDAYPDIYTAIKSGAVDSAAHHYRRNGRFENRLTSGTYLHALVGGPLEARVVNIGLSIDAAIIGPSGNMLIVGWIDDRGRPLRSVSAILGNEGANTRAIGRCRRPDVDGLLNTTGGFSFGFWLLLTLDKIATGATVIIRARLVDGTYEQREIALTRSPDADLRDTVLGHFAALQYYGNRDIEAFAALETGVGRALTRFNRLITSGITALAHAEHYGPRLAKYKASLIICLLGKVEYFFLQNALFSSNSDIRNYEFIYVSNSPELAESLHKEALIAERIYGHSITLVTLPGNAGFSAANNAAARFARSDRVIFVNPDVFPRDDDWAQKHEALIEALPREHTAIFGAPLYYDDGSLMHGGMHFAVDKGLSVKTTAISVHGMVRVEHYGKGAPDWSDRYTRSRPVPAVTGAFISADREWFQSLGGFTEDYIFGHYEDADLCLKSLRQGVPVWLHDIRFWHLEGKGSIRRPPHEGGSLVNRWLFTQKWGDMIAESLVGPSPSHPLLSVEETPAGMRQRTSARG